MGQTAEFGSGTLETAFEWRIRIEQQGLSDVEKEEFDRWLDAAPGHAIAYERASAGWHQFGKLERQDLTKSAVRTSPVLSASSTSLRNRLSSLFSVGPALGFVTAMILLGFWVFPVPQQDDSISGPLKPAVAAYSTSKGEIRTITLPDHSRVTLGAASTLLSEYSDTAREISLEEGAAVFEVVPDANRPFSVQADAVTATALGTVFEVRNSGGTVRVAVNEGRVEFASPLTIGQRATDLMQRTPLAPGEFGAVFDSTDETLIGAIAENTFAAWQHSRLDYEAATLNEIVADANRYYEIPIVLSSELGDIVQRRVTASFPSGDLEMLIAGVEALFPVIFDRSNPEEVVIRSRP
ncbi:MAG: FecR domain-containing protein [Pseudomonadota bacterium]